MKITNLKIGRKFSTSSPITYLIMIIFLHQICECRNDIKAIAERNLGTVKVPVRVQFWHKNVYLSANHRLAFLKR